MAHSRAAPMHQPTGQERRFHRSPQMCQHPLGALAPPSSVLRAPAGTPMTQTSACVHAYMRRNVRELCTDSHCTATANPLHSHCTATAKPLQSHCTATAQPLQSHCTVTERSLNRRGTSAAQALHRRYRVTVRRLLMCVHTVHPHATGRTYNTRSRTRTDRCISALCISTISSRPKRSRALFPWIQSAMSIIASLAT